MEKVLERISKIKTSTKIIVFVIVLIALNFEDCKKGFKDGWNDANEKRETNIENQQPKTTNPPPKLTATLP
jgi:hypothetical protein